MEADAQAGGQEAVLFAVHDLLNLELALLLFDNHVDLLRAPASPITI